TNQGDSPTLGWMRLHFGRLAGFFGFGISITLFSCLNLFSPLDSPSGDEQLISAARACVDRGNLACAFEKYGRVSSLKSDISISETSFAILDRNGANMAAFMDVMGTGDLSGGAMITGLANHLVGKADIAHRQSIVGAYQQVTGIKAPEVRGLVRLMTGMALIAELLAEDLSSGTYTTAKLVQDPTLCAASVATSCPGSIVCSGAPGSIIVSGPAIGDLDVVVPTTLTGPPSFHLIDAAMQKIKIALTQEIIADAGLGARTAAFATQLSNPPGGVVAADYLPLVAASDSPCYRWGMLDAGIGSAL
ncbi:MAG: hypothetical protein AABZ55_15125, partial [Bdellovibrionota bacterium]